MLRFSRKGCASLAKFLYCFKGQSIAARSIQVKEVKGEKGEY